MDFYGTIIERGLFLGIKEAPDTKFIFKKNGLYNQLLVGDYIRYRCLTISDLVTIEVLSIEDRSIQYSVGLVYKKYSDQSFFNIYFPLLANNFSPIFENEIGSSFLGDGDSFMFEISKEGIIPVKYYGNYKVRYFDRTIINDLYLGPDDIKYNLEWIKSHDELYTTNDIIDLRGLNTFNIDPERSLDFDDAISIDRDNNKIYVHIVDIANQIDINSDMEKRGAYLGYTLYLPEENTNMYDGYYSEYLYSLVKGEDRNVITIEIDIDPEEKGYEHEPLIKGYNIYKSTINIKNRYNYVDVEEEYGKDMDITYLRDLTERYYGRRTFIPKPNYVMENNRIKRIDIQNETTVSHLMIEMCMIMTNRIIMEYIISKNIRCPERYHDEPLMIIEENESMDDNMKNLIKIKTYQNAVYDTENTSHYGLQLEHYCHFTSPLRRYNDNIIHRIMQGYNMDNESMTKLIEHINERQRYIKKLNKLYEKWKLMDYLENREERDYEGKIIKITPNGCQIYIESLCYDTFIHISNIMENIRWFYNCDDNKSQLFNNEENIRFFINSKVKVKLNSIHWFSNNNLVWKITGLIQTPLLTTIQTNN